MKKQKVILKVEAEIYRDDAEFDLENELFNAIELADDQYSERAEPLTGVKILSAEIVE